MPTRSLPHPPPGTLSHHQTQPQLSPRILTPTRTPFPPTANPQWSRCQGPAGKPNYLVVNATKPVDAPGLEEAIENGALPYFRRQVKDQIRRQVDDMISLPGVADALRDGLELRCTNVYFNFYPGKVRVRVGVDFRSRITVSIGDGIWG